MVNAVSKYPFPYQLVNSVVLKLIRERKNDTGKSGSRITHVSTESLEFTGFFKQMIRDTRYLFTLYIESKI